jgi:hypothetical protein
MEPLDLVFHSDPSHGWLEIPLATIKLLDVRPSRFSFRDAVNAYLEEDCDAGEAIVALKAAGIPFKITEKDSTNHDSFIRSLPRFSEART